MLTGAGISAESGIKTFRDAGGLWEDHDIMQVATPEGFARNPKLVMRFYNLRRAQLKTVEPNAAHYALARLEEKFEVHIVTQNVDNLHERAGSSQVLHLHGRLDQVRSVDNPDIILPWEEDLNIGDLGPDGEQLRPHIVWFGEDVPMIHKAIPLFEAADRVLVIGTSLMVYPAAGLVHYARSAVPVIVIDPNVPELERRVDAQFIRATAVEGVPPLVEAWLA